MASSEWLRTFVMAYRSGSISEAARLRHISQPAATHHIRQLELAAGTSLFVRGRDGVVPTAAGKRLFADVSDPLDRLGGVLIGLDGGVLPISREPLRIGATPEVFAGFVLPKIAELSQRVDAVFGDDEELHRALAGDEVDLIVTTTPNARRSVTNHLVGHLHYALVAHPEYSTHAPTTLQELGEVLSTSPWVCYSSDLPKTRRFWRQHLDRPFDAVIGLVAHDLRVVLSAVERNLGATLLPTLVCESAIARGSVIEFFPVRDLIEPKPIWTTLRQGVDLGDVSVLTTEIETIAISGQK